MNFKPDLPEAEIMHEYIDAWEYLYEPSRYLARAYDYFLAMQPLRRRQAKANEASWRQENGARRNLEWRRILGGIQTLGKIIWRQGVRQPYRRLFWNQLIGMLWRNPSRFEQYIASCVMGEDLYYMRRVVAEKVTAIIKEQ